MPGHTRTLTAGPSVKAECVHVSGNPSRDSSIMLESGRGEIIQLSETQYSSGNLSDSIILISDSLNWPLDFYVCVCVCVYPTYSVSKLAHLCEKDLDSSALDKTSIDTQA